MDHWGVRHRAMYIGQGEEHGSRLPSNVLNEEGSSDEEEEEEEEEEKVVKTEPVFMLENVCLLEDRKRKRPCLNHLREVKEESSGKPIGRKLKIKKHESKDRWSAERYNLAEKSMWEVLKAEGATFDNPITRPALRMAARKRIGDTGLLDHLLKHIDGKVAPGGIDRFRRWFNTNGIMEYWLESADLDKVRQEAGVQDPFWIPRSRPGSAASQDMDSSDELKLLKEEMAQMKKDMQEILANKQEKHAINMMEETQKEFGKWKVMTEHRLTEIMTSVKSVQGKYGELMIWKTKAEQQLMELTNKLSDLQASRECTTFSPHSEKWKDWIESTNLDNAQDDEFATWIGGSELLNVPQGVVREGPNSAPFAPLPNEEPPTNKSSELLPVVPVKKEDQPNVTPDSSTTVNSSSSKSDIDNSLVMFQEMFMDLYKWKDKMEQQLLDLSNTVYGMLAMK